MLIDLNDEFDKIYDMFSLGENDQAIDHLYKVIEICLDSESFDAIDNLFLSVNSYRLTDEGIVALLIATLGSRDFYTNRPKFIDRSYKLLDPPTLHTLIGLI